MDGCKEGDLQLTVIFRFCVLCDGLLEFDRARLFLLLRQDFSCNSWVYKTYVRARRNGSFKAVSVLDDGKVAADGKRGGEGSREPRRLGSLEAMAAKYA